MVEIWSSATHVINGTVLEFREAVKGLSVPYMRLESERYGLELEQSLLIYGMNFVQLLAEVDSNGPHQHDATDMSFSARDVSAT